MAALAAVLVTCCATSLDFRQYRACVERPGSQQHDPGTVVWEELGDDGRRHYGFLADRLKDDKRQVLDVTRINRTCVLVTGVTRDGRPVAIDERREQ